MNTLDRVLQFLEKLMTLASAFFLGQKIGEDKRNQLEKEKSLAELKAKEAQVEMQIRKDAAGKSSKFIIREAIGSPGSDDTDPTGTGQTSGGSDPV